MFAENKYVNTNQIFSDDKVASDPYWSLIYITNEVAIKKKKAFFGRIGNRESQICSLSALPSMLWCPLHTALSTVRNWNLEATEASKLFILNSSKNKLDFPESFPLFWTLTPHPQEL